MRVLLSAAGRAFLRTFLITFSTFALGIWMAPNFNQALSLAVAASIASVDAALRALRVFAPDLAKQIAALLHVPERYSEVVITGIQTFIAGLIALLLTVLAAPDLTTARSAALSGLIAIGTALTRVLQGWLTPGEAPGGTGISVPPQNVSPASLPPIAPPSV